MKSISSILALAAWALALGACMTAASPPQPEPAPAPTQVPGSPGEGTPPPSSVVAGPIAGSPDGTPPNPIRACHLPAAKKSDDSCKSDADCGPSAPCHAPACVAKAKSKPRTPDIMCTMMLGCETADANRCGCFEGRCALIPPDDAAKE
jgi:hypothetical protein